MSTLEGRTNEALLVIDVQRGVVQEAYRRTKVVDNIRSLVARAREQQTPVVWVAHEGEGLDPGSDAWQYVEELPPGDDEPFVRKRYGDAFEGTTLEQELATRGVDHLIVTGAATDACIRCTTHGGFTRGYDVTLVADAHTTQDLSQHMPGLPGPAAVIAHANVAWSYTVAPGRRTQVVPTGEVKFRE